MNVTLFDHFDETPMVPPVFEGNHENMWRDLEPGDYAVTDDSGLIWIATVHENESATIANPHDWWNAR